MNETCTLYLDTWTEHEHGARPAPDGGSLHTSEGEYRAFVSSYKAQLPRACPDAYSVADGCLTAVEVPVAVRDFLIVIVDKHKNMQHASFFEHGIFITTESVEVLKSGGNPFKDL